MRIDVIMLISGLSPDAIKARKEGLESLASPDTEIRLVTTRNAPPSVESQAEMELAAPGILERVVLSENEGADAIIIWGGHDPSLDSAREIATIPVIGPGMASMYLAASLSKRFALLVQLSNVVTIAKRQIQNLGLEKHCIGIYPVGLPVLQLGRPESFGKVLATSINAIDEGADSICFGCMALNNHANSLKENLEKSHPEVVVIHPGRAAISLAKTFVEMEISHSKRSYPCPPKPLKFP
jgi:allantoin racemase